MAHPLTERRMHSRFGGETLAGIRAVLRPGHVVSIRNLSAGGALIVGTRPLRPGSRVFLQITVRSGTGGRASQVLRCSVAALSGVAGITYCAAIRFEDLWESLWERCTLYGAMSGTDDEMRDGVAELPLIVSTDA